MMNYSTKTTTTKPSELSRADATQAFRETAETGSAQADGLSEKASTAAADAQL